MRRILWAALLLAGLLTCPACGARQHPQTDAADEGLIVIGMCQVGAESDWRVANSESMKAVFTEENGYRLLFEDARQKQDNQIAAIRKFIQQQVDYILLMPLCVTGWDSVLQEARDAGIPVILVDRMAQVEDDSLYAAHVGSDFRWEGEQAIAWLEESFQDEARPVHILHIQGTLGSSAQLERTAALEKAVAAHENWTLLAQLDGDFTQAKTYEAACRWLDGQPERPDIHVLYCENDNAAFGAIQALEEQGYSLGPEGVRIITFDATREALAECMDGRIALAVECNPLLGPLVEEVIRTLEAGQVPDKHHYVEERTFTAGELTEALIAGREY